MQWLNVPTFQRNVLLLLSGRRNSSGNIHMNEFGRPEDGDI